MRALVIYCHPVPTSYTAAVRDTVVQSLQDAGVAYRVADLYADGFNPVLSAEELAIYTDSPANQAPVQAYVDDLLWADRLIFVYPTWWYGLPAMLKGWMDRVLVPEVAFKMPAQGEDIAPGLTHIRHIAVFTTCGASRWLTFLIGAPGKRTLLRGIRVLCGPGCKTTFRAHYLMDSATPASRARHLDRVRRAMARVLA